MLSRRLELAVVEARSRARTVRVRICVSCIVDLDYKLKCVPPQNYEIVSTNLLLLTLYFD